MSKELCCYCEKKADGPMLSMGSKMAHADCAIQKLNELLDYDYDGSGKPIEVIGYRKKGKPPLVKLDKDEDPTLYSFEEGTKLQRVADIKHYEGGK